ncbi:hypothetical protein LAZ67_10001746, partial [Cordylochernes scorpioides]
MIQNGAVGRMEAGKSQVEVEKWLNVNKSVVSKIWKQFIETGTIKRKEGSGRKSKTATSEDRYLVVTAKRHREMTAIQLSNVLSSATGTRISRQTVYRRLHEGALYAKQLMTHTPPYFFWGHFNAQRYRDEILEPYQRPYRDQIGHNLIFMDDNARSHRARLVNEYLQSENIRRMDWPARSPDLNPIEHVWDALGRRIGARHSSPRTLVELRTALLEEWGLLPLDLLQSLVNSMRARCETLIAVRDESRFCLSSDSRRVRVWRRRGERSNPAAIVERPTVRQRGIMVWGAIAYDSRSPLLRIQGTMTAQRYVDDVLRPVTLPYLQGVPNALYQQDNARPHTARISQQALQDVQILPWPPYSPDLSPIEHVWDIIGRRLHALPQPRSEDELWQMVEREWRAISQDAIRTLIDSLPRRVAACIAVR